MRCRGRAVAAARASAKPTHSSNSKSSIIRSCARSLTCLLQLRFQGIAVDAVVRLVQLVREVVHLVDGVARDDPQRLRLLPSPVLLARERLRERRVRRLHGAGVREGRAALLLTEDLEDHAASARTTLRTHASCSSMRRRKSSRSCVFGPCPVTTCFSSSQSGSLYSQTSSSFLRNAGSGTVSPSSQICGT